MVVAWSNSLETDEHPLVANPNIAYAYGFFLGDRYRSRTHIIWLLGGDAFGRLDRATLPATRRRMTRVLAEGIADGVAGVPRCDGEADWSRVLMSYHPPGGGKSLSEFLHNESWLDFNMIQTTTRISINNYEIVSADYDRVPAKPTLDAEVAYEYSLPHFSGQIQKLTSEDDAMGYKRNLWLQIVCKVHGRCSNCGEIHWRDNKEVRDSALSAICTACGNPISVATA